MLFKIVFSIVLVMGSLLSHGQTTCTGNYVLSTQSQVDQFLLDHPTCSTLDGNLTVRCLDSNSDQITNLDGLSNITEINGKLTIMDGQYFVPYDLLPSPDFTGLLSLLDVDVIEISHLSDQGDISYLDNLERVHRMNVNGGQVSMSQPLNLIDIFPSLNELDSLEFSIKIQYYSADAPGLLDCNISGFNSIDSCQYISFKSDVIGDGSKINQFDCFNNLVYTPQLDLSDWVATEFTSFSILESLNNFSFGLEYLYYFNLDEQTDIIEFPSLQLVTGYISIFSWSQGYANLNFPVLTHVQTFAQSNCNSSANLLIEVEENLYFDFWSAGNFHLNSLQHIGGNLTMYQTHISDLSFLQNVSSIDGSITISGNPSLSNCYAQAVCDKIATNPELVSIEFNSVGCNDISEAAVGCVANYVSGNVYIDRDCDGIFNNEDFNVHYPIITDMGGMPTGYTSFYGNYYMDLEYNSSYEFQVQSPPGVLPGSTILVNTTATDVAYTGYDFPLCPDPDYHDVSAYVGWSTRFRPGFVARLDIDCTNLSNNTEVATVVFDYGNMPGVTFESCNLPYTLSGSTVTIDLISFAGYENTPIELAFMVGSDVPLGTIYELSSSISILPVFDENLSDNIFTRYETVTGSYDPNDISANITAINYTELPDDGEWITYLIRFQNTGTANAEFVRIINEQDENLDMSSIQMLNSSHIYELNFDGRELEWYFDNIQLPDSASDLEGSQGFVSFRIKTNTNVTISDIIESTAAIYFDYNLPVITNTATTIFYTCPEQITATGTIAVCEGGTVELNASQGWENYQWMLGNEVVGDQSSVSLGGLASGIYNLNYSGSTQYCESMDMLELTILETPEAPTITQNINTLTASGSGLFTWMFDGVLLDETSNTVDVIFSGNYSVTVTTNGCESAQSSGDYAQVGVEELNSSGVALYPNPVNDFFTLSIPEELIGKQIIITDMLGKVVSNLGLAKSKTTVIESSILSNGVYQIQVGSKRVVLIKN
jgi:hypothetical protein